MTTSAASVSGLIVRGLDISTALKTMRAKGAFFFSQALPQRVCAALQRELLSGPFQALPEEVGPVTQQVHGYSIHEPMEGYPLTTRLHHELVRLVRRHGTGFGELSSYMPNEASVQLYKSGSSGISAHLDHKRFIHLIAIFTICGRARFAIRASRNGEPIQQWDTQPGSLVLMRAAGFEGHPDGRPFHEVGGPEGGDRITLAFRTNSSASPWPTSSVCVCEHGAEPYRVRERPELLSPFKKTPRRLSRGCTEADSC